MGAIKAICASRNIVCKSCCQKATNYNDTNCYSRMQDQNKNQRVRKARPNTIQTKPALLWSRYKAKHKYIMNWHNTRHDHIYHTNFYTVYLLGKSLVYTELVGFGATIQGHHGWPDIFAHSMSPTFHFVFSSACNKTDNITQQSSIMHAEH